MRHNTAIKVVVKLLLFYKQIVYKVIILVLCDFYGLSCDWYFFYYHILLWVMNGYLCRFYACVIWDFCYFHLIDCLFLLLLLFVFDGFSYLISVQRLLIYEQNVFFFCVCDVSVTHFGIKIKYFPEFAYFFSSTNKCHRMVSEN